jgi:hypothetical protein
MGGCPACSPACGAANTLGKLGRCSHRHPWPRQMAAPARRAVSVSSAECDWHIGRAAARAARAGRAPAEQARPPPRPARSPSRPRFVVEFAKPEQSFIISQLFHSLVRLGFFSLFYGLLWHYRAATRRLNSKVPRARQYIEAVQQRAVRGPDANFTDPGAQRVRRGGRQGSVRDVDLSAWLPWASRTRRLPCPWPFLHDSLQCDNQSVDCFYVVSTEYSTSSGL